MKRAMLLFRNLFRRSQVEQELADEIDGYRQMLEDEQPGDPAEARRRARLEMGNAELLKEEVRDVRIGHTIETIIVELRQSLRSMARNPGLTTLAALMLALGIGATTVVFSVFYAVMVQPLPYHDANRLMRVWESRMERSMPRISFTAATFWDVRHRNRSFSEVAAWHGFEPNLTGLGDAEKIDGLLVSAGFFRALGVTPLLGRDFSYDEDRPGSAGRVVLLGHRFWISRFGSDPQVLGKVLTLDGNQHTVIGVMPAIEPLSNEEIFVPFVQRTDANRGSWEFGVIGRLRGGVSEDQARADLAGVAAGLVREYPEVKGLGFTIQPLPRVLIGDNTRQTLWVLLGAVGFLLLIACLNLANLLLARATSRARELAVRTAMGASRGRLIRLTLTESIVLCGVGAGLGVALAYAALRLIRTLEVNGFPRLDDASLHPWVLTFTVAISVATGILAGLAPALRAPARAIASTLRDGDRGHAGSRKEGRLRSTLVMAEVALCFLLLIGAGLLMRSFSRLITVERGFQTENRIMFSVNMPSSYGKNRVGENFVDRYLTEIAALPQILSVGAISHRPISGGDPGMGIVAFANQDAFGRNVPWSSWRFISPGYFRTIGLRLLKGREFSAGDRKDPVRQVILSDQLATLLFPKEDPIGKHVALWKGQGNLDAEVVGVVSDMRERGPLSSSIRTVYLSYGDRALPGEFVVHATGSPSALIPVLRARLAQLDPQLPMSDIRTLDETVNRSISRPRLNAILFGTFAVLALVLATTGIFGVLSYSMSRRMQEIGLRMALGASTRDITGLVLRQGMAPALAGIVAGALGAAWLSNYLLTMLYNIKPFDPLTYGTVAALLLLTALLASLVPARRAMRVDPATALRVD